MKTQSFETAAHELTGFVAVDFTAGTAAFLSDLFSNYNPELFTPVSLRFFLEEEHWVITLYAYNNSGENEAPEQDAIYPVKKFKTAITHQAFVKAVDHFGVSLHTAAFDVDNMRVTNK